MYTMYSGQIRVTGLDTGKAVQTGMAMWLAVSCLPRKYMDLGLILSTALKRKKVSLYLVLKCPHQRKPTFMKQQPHTNLLMLFVK